jgi:hypothetical protein
MQGARELEAGHPFLVGRQGTKAPHSTISTAPHSAARRALGADYLPSPGGEPVKFCAAVQYSPSASSQLRPAPSGAARDRARLLSDHKRASVLCSMQPGEWRAVHRPQLTVLRMSGLKVPQTGQNAYRCLGMVLPYRVHRF